MAPASNTNSVRRSARISTQTKKRPMYEDDSQESDNESSAHRSESPVPNPKRRKYTKSVRAGNDKKGKRKTVCEMDGLSLFEQLPIDVLCEIFQFMEPQHMLMLARTNRNFRTHLMSRNAQVIWKRARTVFGVPDPMPGCSEPKWANLLFGGTKCQNCGTVGVQRIDFGLCRRLCVSCLKKHLVVASKFARKFSEYDPELMALISYTNTGGWTSWRSNSSRYYWTEDVHSMARQLDQYQEKIDFAEPGAFQALKDFKQNRKDAVAETLKRVDPCNRWYTTFLNVRAVERARNVEARKDQISDEFLKMGYLQEDIAYVLRQNSISADNKPMSKAVWTKTKNRLEPEIIKRRIDRLRPLYIKSLAGTFEKWARTLQVAEWTSLPSVELFALYSPVVSMLPTSITTAEPKKDHYDYIIDRLPDLCHSWFEDRTRHFRQIVAQARKDGHDIPLSERFIIFRCSCCIGWIIGENAAIRHRCGYGTFDKCWEKALSINVEASKYVGDLVKLLGKDPFAHSPLDLDLQDSRLMCLSCAEESAHLPFAFTWRQMINHAHRSYGLLHEPALLNASDLERVQRAEQSQSKKEFYLCAHCTTFYPGISAQSLKDIEEHVRNSHCVSNPIEPRDFVWDHTCDRTRARAPTQFSHLS